MERGGFSELTQTSLPHYLTCTQPHLPFDYQPQTQITESPTTGVTIMRSASLPFYLRSFALRKAQNMQIPFVLYVTPRTIATVVLANALSSIARWPTTSPEAHSRRRWPSRTTSSRRRWRRLNEVRPRPRGDPIQPSRLQPSDPGPHDGHGARLGRRRHDRLRGPRADHGASPHDWASR